ncbi:RNA polymerase sigma-70 factor [Carboxylicivirga sp. M1479]|uniref:RNA polymerase sigma-70 factor n=1 Tax=Carboxylicivirga sp. M1479 TaxID=2594476 RepID=UPI001178959B|nr:RNA polymerase sigma-70 factor [Carboxylicivirga sp. M1479]TRX62012.1 RNA polymerase sigma-70 factor [Carboxylicivirga sp. M1479]
MRPSSNEQKLFNDLKSSDKRAFDSLFKLYYTPLCRFALTIIRSESMAEEAVQDTFVHLWEKRTKITQATNVKSYLFKSVYNQCLWLIKKNKTQRFYENKYALEAPTELSDEEQQNWEAFKTYIQSAVSNLPDKCRQIFLLRRYEGLTNTEIAEYLNLSIKTVDNQLSIAIHKLKKELHPHIKNLIIVIFIGNL